MKKSNHIYFIVPVLLALFLIKSSLVSTDNSSSFKKQSFELKTCVANLSDLEDLDESQNKIRFTQHILFSSKSISGDSGYITLNFSKSCGFSPLMNPSAKRALLEVFRL